MSDVSACEAACNALASCSFIAFCPSGTTGCPSGSQNKCALYSTCASATSHQGYTTFSKPQAYTMMAFGANGCENGAQISTEQECREAMLTLFVIATDFTAGFKVPDGSKYIPAGCVKIQNSDTKEHRRRNSRPRRKG